MFADDDIEAEREHVLAVHQVFNPETGERHERQDEQAPRHAGVASAAGGGAVGGGGVDGHGVGAILCAEDFVFRRPRLMALTNGAPQDEVSASGID